MGYIQDLEEKLRALLEHDDMEGVVKLAKNAALESFQNGIMAGKMKDAEQDAEHKTRRWSRGK